MASSAVRHTGRQQQQGFGLHSGEHVKIPSSVIAVASSAHQHNSADMRRLPFTVEEVSFSCPDGAPEALREPGKRASWKGGVQDGWVLLRLHEKALLSFMTVHNRSTTKISIALSVTGKRQADFVKVKRDISLPHDYAKDVKIGHLPCKYIRVDCHRRGEGCVSLHELIPVGIPAKCVGRYMGPSMEDLTLKSTQRLLFGPSLRTSQAPVCSAAALERLIQPPSYLRPEVLLPSNLSGGSDGTSYGDLRRSRARSVAASATASLPRGRDRPHDPRLRYQRAPKVNYPSEQNRYSVGVDDAFGASDHSRDDAGNGDDGRDYDYGVRDGFSPIERFGAVDGGSADLPSHAIPGAGQGSIGSDRDTSYSDLLPPSGRDVGDRSENVRVVKPLPRGDLDVRNGGGRSDADRREDYPDESSRPRSRAAPSFTARRRAEKSLGRSVGVGGESYGTMASSRRRKYASPPYRGTEHRPASRGSSLLSHRAEEILGRGG